jgi:thiosulfate reductase cytochrome b subunit
MALLTFQVSGTTELHYFFNYLLSLVSGLGWLVFNENDGTCLFWLDLQPQPYIFGKLLA